MTIKKYPSKEIINHFFSYKDGELFWKIKTSKNSNVIIGDRAGTTHSVKYRYIYIKSIPYLEHRLIWIMFNGDIPEGMEVDHKIGCSNKIENLRIATHSQNQHNQGLYSSNKTDFKGVHFNKRLKKFTASIRVDKILKHLGVFDSAKDASLSYNNAANLLHKEFANY